MIWKFDFALKLVTKGIVWVWLVERLSTPIIRKRSRNKFLYLPSHCNRKAIYKVAATSSSVNTEISRA